MKRYCTILGLPNVGKSSLFNYLVGENSSIVWNEPDTTVDYLCYNFKNFTLVDTCGLHGMDDLLSVQKNNFYKNSDVILYVIDNRKDDFTKDRILLNRIISDKQVWLVCNFFFEDVDFHLPYHKIFFINKNFAGCNVLKQALNLNLDSCADNVKSVILLGASNVGKSTLFNSIVKSDRSVTENKIGTTIDSVKERIKDYIFVDTAGFKKNFSALDQVILKKKYNLMEKAYCLVIVIDGSVGFTKLDKFVLNFINQYGTCSMLVVNKSDKLCDDFKYQLKRTNVQVPIVYTSSLYNKLNNFWYMLDSFNKKIAIDYESEKYKLLISSYIKNTNVYDKNNKSFMLKSLKLIQINPFIFLYKSYFPLSIISEKSIIKSIKRLWKIYGFRVVLQHKK